MAIVSDPANAAAYNEVRQDKSGKNWALFGFDGNSNKVVVKGTGSGGFQELKGHLQEDQVLFAFVRFQTGDEESKRAKFIFLTWCGEKVKSLARAKLSVQKGDMKQVIRDFALEWHATTQEDLNEEKIMHAVVKAGGANYMGQAAGK